MPRRRKNRRRNKNIINLKSLILNITFGCLVIIIIGYLSSGINRLFFNLGEDANYPDLSTLITQTSYEKNTGHKIQIEIWNGCGISNLAMMYTDFLRNEGFDVLNSKNADHFNYQNTTILQHKGKITRAVALADILELNTDYIIQENNTNLFYDLTLIIGHDYNTLSSYKNVVLFQPPF